MPSLPCLVQITILTMQNMYGSHTCTICEGCGLISDVLVLRVQKSYDDFPRLTDVHDVEKVSGGPMVCSHIVRFCSTSQCCCAGMKMSQLEKFLFLGDDRHIMVQLISLSPNMKFRRLIFSDTMSCMCRKFMLPRSMFCRGSVQNKQICSAIRIRNKKQ